MQDLVPIPPHILAALLPRPGSRSGRPHTEPEARACIALDMARRGEPKSQRDYAEEWGWTRARVRYNWDRLYQDVVSWFGDLAGTPATAQQQPTPQPKNDPQSGVSGATEAIHNPATAHEQPNDSPAEPPLHSPPPSSPLHPPSFSPPLSPPAAAAAAARECAREADPASDVVFGSDSKAQTLDELTDEALRYRRQIEAQLAATPQARRQYAYRAFRAGNMPAAEVPALLDAAEARAGPLATAAAVVVTANKAQAKYPKERLEFFHRVLATIEDHVYRTRIGTDEENADRSPGHGGGGDGALRGPSGGPESTLPARLRRSPAGAPQRSGGRGKRDGELSGEEYLERAGYTRSEIRRRLGLDDDPQAE